MMSRLKKYFFSGLAVFLPFALAIYVFVWIMNFAEGLFGKPLKAFFLEYYDFYFWGLGIVCLLAVILLCGFLITNYFGRAVHNMTEYFMLRVPILNNLYPAFKEIARFVFKENVSNFQQVVLVEWPRQGVYSIGFLTNDAAPKINAKTGRKLKNVMIPTVPNPLTGFVAMVPEEDIVPLDITVEEAVRIIVSGGVLNNEISDEKTPAAS